MTSRDKIQSLLISHLLKHGTIQLQLPDSIKLEIGITQDGKNGKNLNNEYCWISASREDKSVALDAYNLGLEFIDESGMLFIDDSEERISLNVV